MKVYDVECIERDLPWAEAKYGVEFMRAEVARGQKVYRLTELWEKTGHTSLITQVLDEDGHPVDRADVAFYWPDAPSPPDPPTETYPHDWHPNFVHGETNIDGDVGPGMGHGAYHGEGEGGPHAVWVRDPNIPSDICQKLGMLAGTFHDHLDQKFKLTVEGGAPMPTPQGGRFVEIGGRRFERTESENLIFVTVAQGQGRNFYDTALDLCVGNDPDHPDYVYPEPFGVADVYTYRVEVPYVPEPGEQDRTFWAVIRHVSTEEILSDPMPFWYQTNVYGISRVEVAWQTGEGPGPGPGPGPEPTPLPDNLAEIFEVMAGEHLQIAECHAQLAEQCYEAKRILGQSLGL